MALNIVNGYAIGNKLTTIWYPTLKKLNVYPVTSSFSVNYGSINILSYSILGNNKIEFILEREVGVNENLIFSYTPPGDVSDLTAPVPPGASQAVLESAKANEIIAFKVDNLTTETEDKTNYNLSVNYPVSDNGTPSSAVVDDFIATYGHQEALQLSNINDASATLINERRIERAIEDANSLIDAYVEQAPKANKLLVSSSRRRTSLIIARYYLDSVRRRKDVVDDYERAIKELDQATDPTRGGLDPTNPELAINNGGVLRYHLTPQRYNSESGKGFAGWAADPAYDHQPDFRISEKALDNNNLSNDNASKHPQGTTVSPNDDGGTQYGAND